MGCQRTCSASTHRAQPLRLNECQQLPILSIKKQDNEPHTIAKSCVGFAPEYTKRGGNRSQDIERAIGKSESCAWLIECYLVCRLLLEKKNHAHGIRQKQ